MTIRNVPTTLTLAACVLATRAFAQAPEALPNCVNNGPYSAECAGLATSVPTTSAGSFDPDGTPITVQWFEECPWGFFDDPTAPDSNYVIDMTGFCQRTCVFELRIFSGGEVRKCNSTATVQDTLPPVLSTLQDITDIWGIPTDVGSTGFPSAVDACDPAPVVTMINQTIIPQQGPGHEQTIIRTFEAVDSCNHASQTTQTITLLSPLANAANLEVDTTQCDDVFDRAESAAHFDVVLLGRPGTQIAGIRRDTLRLQLLGVQAPGLAPLDPWQFASQDVSIRAATHVGDCNPAGTDGLKDLRLRFDREKVRALLGVDALPAGAAVYIAVWGKRLNNTTFVSGAKMILK